MATSKKLMIPEILSIQGSSIRIKHPTLSENTQTSLISPFTAAATALSVRDNRNFSDDDWMILGSLGHAKTEEVDVNGAVTRGTSLTLTNSTKFNHEIDTPVTKIFERGIKIYGASTDGGAGTLIASVDAKTASTNQLADAIMIQWDKPSTDYTLISTDTTYAYYFVKFTDGTTDSDASDYVLAAGQTYNSGREMVQSALDLVRAEVDNRLITWDFLLDCVNDFQDEVTNFVLPDGTVKDWPFEIFEDLTSITLTQSENKYAVSALTTSLKYPDSDQGIIQVKLGSKILKTMDLDEYETQYNGIVRTEVATEGAVGATSLVLDDTYELSDSGTLNVGSMTTTYTGKTDSTGTITGIPASGTGSITSTATVDMVVWQNVATGYADRYTIFNNEFLLNLPVDEERVGQKLKVKYYGVLPRVTSLSDAMVVPFVHLGKFYIAAQIESRKKNAQSSDKYLSLFREKLLQQAQKQMSHMAETFVYYTINNP